MPTFDTERSPRKSLSPTRGPFGPNIYSTPRTPMMASIAQLGNRSTSVGSRKRPRPESPNATVKQFQNDYSRYGDHWQAATEDSPYTTARSPPPLANSRYRLAGGLDTPSVAAAATDDNFDGYSDDIDFRRRWSSRMDGEDRQPKTTQGLDRERNGKGAMQRRITSTAQDEQESWSRFIFRIAGGLAGKAWEFCRPNAFQGFTAGRGTGYGLSETTTPIQNDIDYRHRNRSERGSTPVPGRYPIEEDYEQVMCPPSASDHDADQPPATKRLQLTQGSDWVIVNHSSSPVTRHSAAQRASSGLPVPASSSASIPSSQQRSRVPRPIHQRTTTTRNSSLCKHKPTSRTSSASFANSTPPQPHIQPRPASQTASYASPRSSTRLSNFRPDPPPQPQQQIRSPSSRLSAKPSTHLNTPPSAEAARYAAARAKQERQTDASVKRLNERLTAMIRQGQEALASKVEVDYGEDEIAFEDGYDDGMDESMVDEGYGEGPYEERVGGGVGKRCGRGMWR